MSGLPRNADFASNTNALVSTVPEPQTYALMIACLLIVGGLARRRQA